VADQPFATLDPTLRRVYIGPDRFVRMVDTVGFITELPKELVNAFRATLEELDGADVLVHVIDASNPDWPRQRASVETILHDLKLDTKPTVLAFNKIDAIPEDDAHGWASVAGAQDGREATAVGISAVTGAHIDELRAAIEARLDQARAPAHA
jgi:GTP-binding protein HflX